MSKVYSYSPKNVFLHVDGNLITSWDEVQFEKAEDDWDFEAATTGGVTRSRIESELGSATITLPQASSDNAVLERLNTDDKQKYVGLPPMFHTVTIVDSWGKTEALLIDATFVKTPALNFKKKADKTVWKLTGQLVKVNASGDNIVMP